MGRTLLAGAARPTRASSAVSIDTAAARHLFAEILAGIGIPNPPGAAVADLQQARSVALTLGYPVLVRPSYWRGGRAMAIVPSAHGLLPCLPQTRSPPPKIKSHTVSEGSEMIAGIANTTW